MNTIKCPCCGSSKLLVYSETAYWLNTGEHFCHSVKSHDKIAKVKCSDCDWQGKLKDVEISRCNKETNNENQD